MTRLVRGGLTNSILLRPGGRLVAASNGNDSFTKILLHMDGADTSTTFTDDNAGGSAHTWTANGNAQIDTAISQFGGAAGLFDGTGDYITTPDHADFTLGSGEWTVDFWFNRAGGDGTNRVMCGQSDSAGTDSTRPVDIRLTTANVVQAAVYDSAQKTIVGTTAFTATGWHHVAVVRTVNTVKLFVDGTQEGSDTAVSGALADSANAFSVGRLGERDAIYWNGSIDEFRLSVGVARWTTNFTPPTGAYS